MQTFLHSFLPFFASLTMHAAPVPPAQPVTPAACCCCCCNCDPCPPNCCGSNCCEKPATPAAGGCGSKCGG